MKKIDWLYVAFDSVSGIFMFAVSVLSIPDVVKILLSSKRGFCDSMQLLLACAIFCMSISLIVRSAVLSAYRVIRNNGEDEEENGQTKG